MRNKRCKHCKTHQGPLEVINDSEIDSSRANPTREVILQSIKKMISSRFGLPLIKKAAHILQVICSLHDRCYHRWLPMATEQQ